MNNELTPQNATARRFTLEEATAMLPLVRSIATDICGAFRDVMARRVELHRLMRKGNRGAGRLYDDEILESRADLQAEYDQIWRYREELESLGVCLRQPEEGLVEFPTELDGHEAFFVWQLSDTNISNFRLATDEPGARWPLASHQN